MTEQNNDLGTAADKANQIWGDLIPVLGFLGVYNAMRIFGPETGVFQSKNAIFWGTGVLIVLLLGIVANRLIKGQEIPLFMIVSSVIVATFGAIGILAQNEAFFYVKITIQQLFLASLILVPLLFGVNLWRLMFKSVFDLPDHAWVVLSVRWGLFFIAMALWNEYLWRTYAPIAQQCLPMFGAQIAPCEVYGVLGFTFGEKDAESVWANWRLGNMVITFVFGAANVPYTLKHLQEPEAA